MKRTRPLLLLVGAVASLACVSRACARGRTHTRRPSPLIGKPDRRASWWVVPAALIVGSPHAWGFDAGAVWGGIWSFLGNIGSDIKSWVLEAIQKAADFIIGIINTVDDFVHLSVNILTGGFDWLVHNAVNAAEAVAGVVVKTYDMLDAAFANFRDQAKTMLEHAWDDLKAWILDPVGDFFGGVFGEGWKILKQLIALGIDGVNFLIALATDPFGTIWDLIKDAVKDTIGFALPPLEWIVQTGLDILFSGYGDVVAVLKAAWHVLVWVAEHAADLTEEALTAGFGIGATAFDDQVVNTLTARSDDLEGIVAKWFG